VLSDAAAVAIPAVARRSAKGAGSLLQRVILQTTLLLLPLLHRLQSSSTVRGFIVAVGHQGMRLVLSKQLVPISGCLFRLPNVR
jgi:hypothetical protein